MCKEYSQDGTPVHLVYTHTHTHLHLEAHTIAHSPTSLLLRIVRKPEKLEKTYTHTSRACKTPHILSSNLSLGSTIEPAIETAALPGQEHIL